MRLIATIALTTGVFIVVQFAAYGLFLAGWFFNFFMRFLVCFGISQPEGGFNTFIYRLLVALTWPVRALLPGDWSGGSSARFFLLLAVNSVIWGIGVGMLLWLLGKIQRRTKLK